MKILTHVFAPLLVLGIIIFFVFKGCGTDVDKVLSAKIRNLSHDGEISKTEFISLKQFIEEHQSEQDEFVNYLSSDSVLYLRIKKNAADKTVYFPVKVIPVEMGNINFYIETSGSMGGYLNRATHFQDVGHELISLLTDINASNDDNSVSYVRFTPNTIAARVTTYTDISQYASELSHRGFSIGGGSPLDEIFKIIADSSNLNDINVLLTDGIMSGPDNLITGTEYNLEERGLMKMQIKLVFTDQRNKNWGTIIYAFNSNFNIRSNYWPYYTYNNTRIWRDFSDRPFYAFVFGHKDLLERITSKIEGQTILDIKEQSYFGMNTQEVSDYVIFKSCFKKTKKNSMIKDMNIKCNTEPNENNVVEFAVGINLSNLPAFMNELDYLNRNVKIEKNNNLIAEVEVLEYPGDIQEYLNKKEKTAVLTLGCTHYITVKLTGLHVTETDLNIKIMKENNNWYEEWSCEDDSDIASNAIKQNQTFNFKYLVQGINDAYTAKGDAITDIKIKLTNNH